MVVNTKKIFEAVKILRDLNSSYEQEAKKQPLLEELTDGPIFLSITMKKIPNKKHSKVFKVELPHSLPTEKKAVCLITGDTDKHNHKAEIAPDVDYFKKMLTEKNITKVNEVVTLRQLRTEYKEFEMKRKLAHAYDIFLCDRKIAQCLPKLLGKRFYEKRKFPILIDMKRSNLKHQIDRALSVTQFPLSCKGATCTGEVASLDMCDEDICLNVVTALNIMKDNIPGSPENINSVYIKLARSVSIPIHLCFEDPSNVKIQKIRNRSQKVTDELSTFPGVNVTVYNSGNVVTKKEDTDSENEMFMGISKKNEVCKSGKVVTVVKENTDSENEMLKLKNEKYSDSEEDSEEEVAIKSKTKVKHDRKRVKVEDISHDEKFQPKTEQSNDIVSDNTGSDVEGGDDNELNEEVERDSDIKKTPKSIMKSRSENFLNLSNNESPKHSLKFLSPIESHINSEKKLRGKKRNRRYSEAPKQLKSIKLDSEKHRNSLPLQKRKSGHFKNTPK